MEVSEYNRRIENTENLMIDDFESVKKDPDLQIFNPDSEEFNPNVYNKAIKDFAAGYIQRDEFGNAVGLKESLKQHLIETAELYKGAIKSGAIKQVRDQRKMKVRSDSKPAETPKESKKDPIMAELLSD
jgi:hypothetical protein